MLPLHRAKAPCISRDAHLPRPCLEVRYLFEKDNTTSESLDIRDADKVYNMNVNILQEEKAGTIPTS